MPKHRLIAAFRAFGVHLALSAFVALLAAFVVLQLWFPDPYRVFAGGLYLFWIMVGVDVVCGPLLTAVLFNPAKSHRELKLDLSLVALMQMAALAYGLYSISQARPVVLVFESDRMVVVSAAQIDPKELHLAPPQFQFLSWTGPVLIGTRAPKDGHEMIKSIDLSMQGIGPSLRPGWWQSYDLSRPNVKERMQHLPALHARQSLEGRARINAAVRKVGQPIDKIYYLPLVSQKSLDQWVMLLDAEANVIGYASVGGFEEE